MIGLRQAARQLSSRPSWSTPCRPYYMWINFVFNRLDDKRLEEFGPDRVAAEWVLRCGGGVKFKKPNIWLWDYNALPPGPKGQHLLEAINAKETSVTTGGLLHLVGLKHLESLNLNGCKYVTDMNKLLPVRKSLTELDISNCNGILDVSPLVELTNLKKLNLSGTARIKNRKDSIRLLQKSLPDCEIEI